MKEKLRKGLIGILLLIALFINLYIALSIANVNAGPSKICEPIGCPGGSQLCATVTIGLITYYCYEKSGKGEPQL
ncbi:hypothetical protein NLC26_02815 [Candidatus Aminicenantes bacterium AC-708-M15]|nr:hypothetical protein [SCandidatus Aminicenantes bacterium Aminicenantia_JdfR_composite]MCP2597535.1 hypothetical protein [Candidatus Aminicenantes bacterium AC-335-G13]MCP2598744.1 hypothetical protein [Candidatus Aminicenantes bacterium AC-335-L06]MCP2604394.1 hypothetical protein [Candidatus Aminicenantes bacterium AC-708-M15]MCP2618969.1 hypothetical protein [Candidatus Aminicenantes bacterium AC-335-A11]